MALKTLAATSAFGSRLLLLYWRQLAVPRITRRSSDFFPTTVKRPRDKGLLNPLVHWTGLSPHDFFRFLYELIVLDGMRLRKFFARCNLGVHIGPSGKTGAVLVVSRRSFPQAVVVPDAEEAGWCLQVSAASSRALPTAPAPRRVACPSPEERWRFLNVSEATPTDLPDRQRRAIRENAHPKIDACDTSDHSIRVEPASSISA